MKQRLLMANQKLQKLTGGAPANPWRAQTETPNIERPDGREGHEGDGGGEGQWEDDREGEGGRGSGWEGVYRKAQNVREFLGLKANELGTGSKGRRGYVWIRQKDGRRVEIGDKETLDAIIRSKLEARDTGK